MCGVDFFEFENVRPESEDLLFTPGDLDLSMSKLATTTLGSFWSLSLEKFTPLLPTHFNISTVQHLPPSSKSHVASQNLRPRRLSDYAAFAIPETLKCKLWTLSSVPCVLPCGVRVIRGPNYPWFGSIAAQKAFRKATMQPTRQTDFNRPLSPQILESHDTFPDAQLAKGCLDPWQPLFRQPHQT